MSMTSMKVSGYQQKINAQIDEYKAEIDKFKAKVNQADGELQVRYANQLSDLEARLVALTEARDNLIEAGEGAAEDLMQSVEQLKDDVKSALDKFAANFR